MEEKRLEGLVSFTKRRAHTNKNLAQFVFEMRIHLREWKFD